MISPVIAQAILGLEAPDIIGSFERGREMARQEQSRQLAGEALTGREGAIQDLGRLDPELSLKLGEMIGARNDKDVSDFLQGAGVLRRTLEMGRNTEALELANQVRFTIRSRGGNSQSVDNIINIMRTDPAGAIEQLRAFEESVSRANTSLQSFAPQQFTKADETIGFGIPTIDPKTGETTFREIQPPEGAQFVSRRETPEEVSAKTTAQQEAKLESELAYKPRIETEVAKARKIAESRGEAFTELEQMEAAMPGLTEAVDQLKALAQVATYTKAGRAFDALSRELGFGVPEGATARAKFIAIVNNQVLPLLKPTFGGAFTVQEGEALRATMGSPDLSPEEKLAQLEAFIAQQERNIREKRAITGRQSGQPQQPTQAAPAPTPAPRQITPPPATRPQQKTIEVDF